MTDAPRKQSPGLTVFGILLAACFVAWPLYDLVRGLPTGHLWLIGRGSHTVIDFHRTPVSFVGTVV